MEHDDATVEQDALKGLLDLPQGVLASGRGAEAPLRWPRSAAVLRCVA